MFKVVDQLDSDFIFKFQINKYQNSEVVLKMVNGSVVPHRLCFSTTSPNVFSSFRSSYVLSPSLGLSRKRWNSFSWTQKPGSSEKSRSAAGTSQLITSALAGIHTLLPSRWSMSEEVHHPSPALPTPPPSLLNASSLFSKLNIVLHRSNPQTRHRLCLQGFPCSFGQGLVYIPPPSAVRRVASSREAIR